MCIFFIQIFLLTLYMIDILFLVYLNFCGNKMYKFSVSFSIFNVVYFFLVLHPTLKALLMDS